MTLSEVTSVWGVSAVAILDCSLNVYACDQQKALTMPAHSVAANCNNSQATQNITMHEFLQNQPTVRWKWIKFVHFKWADFDTVLHHTHLCSTSKHFAECDCSFFVEYCIYQSGIWSQQHFLLCKKHQCRLQNTWNKTNAKRICEADFQQQQQRNKSVFNITQTHTPGKQSALTESRFVFSLLHCSLHEASHHLLMI